MFKKYDAYKDSGVDWLGTIPEEWELKKLKFLLNEINIRSETGDETLLSLSKYKGVIPKDSLEERSGGASTLIGYKKVFKNNLVINKMQAVNGLLAVSELDGITSPDYSIYCARNNLINIHYISFLLNQPEYLAEMKKRVTGVMEGFIRLYTDDLYDIKAIIPSITEQNQIVSFLQNKLAEIDQAIAIKQQQIALLNERKQIVIQKAVTQGLNPNVEMKDSGVEWIGQIPEHWEIVTKLKFISSLKGRQGWQGLKADEYIDEGPFVVSSAHFDGLNIEWHKCPHVSKERYEMDAHIQLKVGDILLMKDGAKMGKLAFVSNLPDLACLNSHLLLIRSLKKADKYFFDAKYMLYFMLSGKFQDYVQVKGTGTTFMGISQESIGNFPLALPSFEEQIEIASFLDQKLSEFDCGKELLLSQIEKLKEYKTTLINDAVTGKIKVA
ncbi:restriction endonuclease subunit S [Acinetobacter ursingii]|uniref:restriction endonuclease subunit S n=1 Tax=Acinetobacter ursingii TaxID=108980 RepID=UPI002499E9E5|nr:restriction endonuclease subunit S [Acinetobacter ursingii]MDI3238901.1 restriction endonuclease subunit S [Acinetobacter ursingii]